MTPVLLRSSSRAALVAALIAVAAAASAQVLDRQGLFNSPAFPLQGKRPLRHPTSWRRWPS